MRRKLYFVVGIILPILSIIMGGVGLMAMATDLTGGGKMAKGGSSLTTDEPMAEDNFYLKAVDERLTKVRPMATPVDTLSRHVSRKTGAKGIEVKYYSVGTQPVASTVSEAVDKQTSGTTSTLKVADSNMFSELDTCTLVGIKGYKADGATADTKDLVVIITSFDTSGNPVVEAINGLTAGSTNGNIWLPAIAINTKIIRMGKACREKDSTAPTYSVVPSAKTNYCQNFMAQVEESTFEKVSDTEIRWNFSDKEEATLYDMKMGMELSTLFGVKGKITDPVKKQLVWLSEGIFWQAGKDTTMGTYDSTTSTTSVNDKQLIDAHKSWFTGEGAGSKKKILFAGSGLISALQKATSDKYKFEMPQIEKWDLTFTSWKSIFGEVLIIHDEIFDKAERSNEGLLVDPEFMNKATFIPFGRNVLDLKKAGVSNVDAVVLQEVSCPYLTNPLAHARVKLATS